MKGWMNGQMGGIVGSTDDAKSISLCVCVCVCVCVCLSVVACTLDHCMRSWYLSHIKLQNVCFKGRWCLGQENV